MAKTVAPKESKAVSLNPADMLAGGLKDDFRGRVIAASYAPWDYDGNIDEAVLAAKLVIKPDDEEETYTQFWSAGSLDSFRPSTDGEEANEGDGMNIEEGPFCVRVGKRTGLNNNTNYAHLMESIVDAGAASGKFAAENFSNSIAETLVGLYAHWNRVPQKKRSGMKDQPVKEGEEKKTRASDVLVVTEVLGYGEEETPAPKKSAAKTAAPAKAAVPAKAAPAAAAGTADPVDERLDEALLGILAETEGATIKKAKLPALMLTAFAAEPAIKSAAVKRVVSADYLTGERPFTYDADAQTLSLG